jgi:agmatine deiminase
MKNYTLLFVLITGLLFHAPELFSQQKPEKKPDWRKLHYLSEEEMYEPVLTGINFTETPPPQGPVRMVAEFEPMQAVLIRYPLGIPYQLIAEMSEDVEVITRVTSQSLADQALASYQANGVNTANCSFLITPFHNSDSYWTRDYGPWFVFDGNKEPGICDFPYNRNRPQDNLVPEYMAQLLDINLFGMNLTHTGGNMMVDGLGIAASTDLLYEENTNLTQPQIHQKAEDYLGITRYDVTIDPLDDYIKHIDCWGKYLAPDKILIGRVPITDYRFSMFENIANFFATTPSSYGYPYKVYRVFTPGNFPYTPYTNSLILNDKVFLPLTGSQHDAQAIQVYQQAMPGYEIIGVTYNGWYNTDALHCRTIGVADLGMLFVDHRPHYGTLDWSDSLEVQATIIPYSGENLHADSLLLFYNINGGGFEQTQLVHQNGDLFTGWISGYEEGDTVHYYLSAADASGRSVKHPYMGNLDAHSFVLGQGPEEPIQLVPDTLYFVTELIKTFKIYNVSDATIQIQSIDPSIPGYAILPDLPEFPYTLSAADSLEVIVELNIPVSMGLDDFITNYVWVFTDAGDYVETLMIDSDLVSLEGLSEKELQVTVWPNPSSDVVNFDIAGAIGSHVRLEVFDVQGRLVSVLYEGTPAGGVITHSWNFTSANGNTVPEGIYLYSLSGEQTIVTGRLLKLKF